MVLHVDVLFTGGECDCNYLDSWSYSKDWVRSLGTKNMLHFTREVKCQHNRVTQEFNISKIFMQDNLKIAFIWPRG